MSKYFLFLIFVPFLLEAKTIELKTKQSSILVNEQSQWVLGKDLFGMPHIYFSPSLNGQRSNISFTDTGTVQNFTFNKNGYEALKQGWAKDVGAKNLGYTPYNLSISKLGHKIHKIGFTYAYEGKTYLETSYYIECKGRVLFSKSLRLKENSQHEAAFNDLVSSIDCEGAQ